MALPKKSCPSRRSSGADRWSNCAALTRWRRTVLRDQPQDIAHMVRGGLIAVIDGQRDIVTHRPISAMWTGSGHGPRQPVMQVAKLRGRQRIGLGHAADRCPASAAPAPADGAAVAALPAAARHGGASARSGYSTARGFLASSASRSSTVPREGQSDSAAGGSARCRRPRWRFQHPGRRVGAVKPKHHQRAVGAFLRAAQQQKAPTGKVIHVFMHQPRKAGNFAQQNRHGMRRIVAAPHPRGQPVGGLGQIVQRRPAIGRKAVADLDAANRAEAISPSSASGIGSSTSMPMRPRNAASATSRASVRSPVSARRRCQRAGRGSRPRSGRYSGPANTGSQPRGWAGCRGGARTRPRPPACRAAPAAAT